MNTLSIQFPSFLKARCELDIQAPFATWVVVDQPLLYQWLDYAVDRKVEKVLIYTDEAEALTTLMEKATLWPLNWEVRSREAVPEGPPQPLNGAWMPNQSRFEDRSIDSGWDLLNHHAYLERHRLEYLQQNVFSQNPEMAVGRLAYVHPEAKLIPPFWIGDEAYVEKGAVVGPYARIGAGSYISKDAAISGSFLDGQTYVGPLTRLQGHHVLAGRVYHREKQVCHPRMDPEIISSLKKRTAKVQKVPVIFTGRA
jgi:hypothetical protein